MNKMQERAILREMKKMLLGGSMITASALALTGCGKGKVEGTTPNVTEIVTEAPTESVTPTTGVTITVTPTEAVATVTPTPTKVPTPTTAPTSTPTPYPEDYVEYDDEIIYDGTLVDGYDTSKFVVGPDGKLYDSQESIDKIFGEQPEDVYAPYEYEGHTFKNYIIYLQFRCDMIEVGYDENGMLVPKENVKTNCK